MVAIGNHLRNSAVLFAGAGNLLSDKEKLAANKILELSKSINILEHFMALERSLMSTRLRPQTIIEMWLASLVAPRTEEEVVTGEALKQLWNSS